MSLNNRTAIQICKELTEEFGMGKSILLVDDDQMFLEIEKEFLKYSHVEVLTANSGLDALAVIRTRHPDLVFMDLQMPKMDGVTCCRAIRSDPALFGIPVVMIISSLLKQDWEDCFFAGCDDFLSKPIEREMFLRIARRFIPEIEVREIRIGCDIDATIIINDKNESCSIRNLSVGGAFIATGHHVIPMEILKISFTIPNSAKIECFGRIRWVNRDNVKLPQGFGMQFSPAFKDTEGHIANYMREIQSL
jgi:CheY-like chemotaxis protein